MSSWTELGEYQQEVIWLYAFRWGIDEQKAYELLLDSFSGSLELFIASLKDLLVAIGLGFLVD